MQKILLTSATSYIGAHLINKLKEKYEVIAVAKNIEHKQQETNVTWRAVELFDLEQAKQVMKDVDIVVYLAHSMIPNAQLTQSNLRDREALVADNFAKAARANDVKHIVFVSSLVPNNVTAPIPLRRNIECERILSFYGTPVTTLQTNFITGYKGVVYATVNVLARNLLPQQQQNIKNVCSITRIAAPNDYTMEQITNTYADFLNKVTFNMVESTIDGKYFEIKLLGLNKVLLSMKKMSQSSDSDRVVYQIVDGALAKTGNNLNGTFEFRRLVNSSQALVALQNYQPSLPWLFYKLTQAQLHKIVMCLFAIKMKKQSSPKSSLAKVVKLGSSISLGTIGFLLAKRIKFQ